MISVDTRDSSDPPSRHTRIERALRRCLEWSRSGRHLKIITEVDRALPAIGNQPELEAQLLIWKAQALLAMGLAERAFPPASLSLVITLMMTGVPSVVTAESSRAVGGRFSTSAK